MISTLARYVTKENILLLSLLCTMSLTGVMAGCHDDRDPFAPERATAAPIALTVVMGDTACTWFNSTITSPTTATANWPDRHSCGHGLTIIRGDTPHWTQANGRKLSLRIRILNQDSVPVQLPVRLFLPDSGTTVVTPPGTPASKVVSLNADSAAAGGHVWLVGGQGILAVGDSTILDTIQFNVQAPVTKVRFGFHATANLVPLPPIPESFTAPTDSTFTVVLPADTTVRYFRNIVGVEFAESATGSMVAAVLAKYQAVIIGGFTNIGQAGSYVLQVPDPGLTFAALDSLRNVMVAEPGVVRVFGIAYRGKLILRARFPTDGLGNSRSDWLGLVNPHVKPWLAVRAPLAWGCETGSYAAPRTKVGIIDYSFDTLHTDLQSSLMTVNQAQATIPDPFLTHPQNGPIVRSHGTAVAGVVAARGDNGTDIAGMIWGADLHLYALATDSLRVAQPDLYLTQTVFPSAIASNVRVLVSSIGAGSTTDTMSVHNLRNGISAYLQAGLGNVLILASGNDAITLSLSALQADTSSTLTALEKAAAQLYPQFPKQILFVTGTTAAGQFRSPANYWTGATPLAAPSDSIWTLARGGGAAFRSGTSFSAPFVAGAAAQLVAMDSTLTGFEIGDYLIRGSTASRRDSTGALVQPSDIGKPNTYLLDAYSSLSLLSKERLGTPLCGFPVKLEYPTTGRRVVLTRNGQNAEQVPIAGQLYSNTLSVAQGGRLFAVNALDTVTGDPNILEYALTGGQWAIRRTIAGVASRTYLEKDTVDLHPTLLTHTIRGAQWGANGTTVDLGALMYTGSPFSGSASTEFSPDAGWAVIRGAEPSQCPGLPFLEQAYLIKLPAGPSFPLLTLPCNAASYFMDAVWDPSGLRFIIGERDDGYYQTTYRPRRIVNNAPVADRQDVQIPNRLVHDYSIGGEMHTTDPTGFTATWQELKFAADPGSGCFLVTRLASGSFPVLSETFYDYNDPEWLGMCQVPIQTLKGRPGLTSQARRLMGRFSH